MTGCRCHCRGCGSHFTSLEAFDAHRSGTPQDRACTFPDDAGLVELIGTCKIAGGPPRVGVTIYGHERAARLRDYHRGANGRQTAPTDAKRAA